ncbi:MAG TPA: hypothetical protein VMB34_33320 [Acetobacteraceae bacterium]|nr:hypothetical protein [Acetobacteraceae bacterium]
MRIFSPGRPRAAMWIALALVGSLLPGCAENPAPQVAGPRLFASDFQGAAKTCTSPKPRLASGHETAADLRLANDGGWCAITVTDDGKPYAAGLLTESPAHGDVYIHPVGATTRIDYTPDAGFVGNDAFVVRLLPGRPELRVNVVVAR